MKSSSKRILHLIKSLGRVGAEMLLSEKLKVHKHIKNPFGRVTGIIPRTRAYIPMGKKNTFKLEA